MLPVEILSAASGNKKQSLQALIEGIGWGLFLTFLVGPILFALLQAGIEYGFRAGAMMGLGIWISDIIYLLAMFWGFQYVQAVSEMAGFEFWMGLIGGIILMVFGFTTFFSPPPAIKYEDIDVPVSNPYGALFTKGFLVNAINPFTVLFWLGMMTSVSVKEDWASNDVIVFFVAIIGTIICTDLLKVYLAKQIRKKLKVKYLVWVRWITGSVLFLFGVILIVRSLGVS